MTLSDDFESLIKKVTSRLVMFIFIHLPLTNTQLTLYFYVFVLNSDAHCPPGLVMDLIPYTFFPHALSFFTKTPISACLAPT